MTKHTPGPWHAEPDYIDPIGSIVITDETASRYLCSIDSVDETDVANARLIAAAPDLLAACLACLDREDIASDELGDVLRAAIAKAKGGAQ